MTSGPWFITGAAARIWAELRHLSFEDARWELVGIAKSVVSRPKTPKRSEGGLLVYRVRKPIDVQLMIDDDDLAEDELPKLVDIRRVRH